MIKRLTLSESLDKAKVVVHEHEPDNKFNVYFYPEDAVLETDLVKGTSNYIVTGKITTFLEGHFPANMDAILTVNVNGTTRLNSFYHLEHVNTTSVNLEKIKNQTSLELFSFATKEWDKAKVMCNNKQITMSKGII